MNRKLVAGVLGVVLAAFLIWFLALRDRGDHHDAAKGHGSGAGAIGARPHGVGATADDDAPATAVALGWDVDPAGTLPLEGQVLDDQDKPVAGAEVTLASSPARHARSEDDGTFTFTKLVGRSYAVSARAGELIGGPVVQQLTKDSPPVVIRLRKGAGLAVHVVADGDAAPIKGASVELRDTMEQVATTDDTGVATFHGVSPGWAQVAANATGYAQGDAATLVGSSAATVDLTVVMHKGAAVSGRVVDEQGQPVANARVMHQDAGRAWQTGSAEKDGQTTSAKGEFSFAAVPPGSFRFVAYHSTLAPASSEPVTVDGSHPTTGVEIVMKPGGVITGLVVGKDGAPVPNATVTVIPKQVVEFQSAGGRRQVVADDRGEFVVHALPRSAVRVRAESDAAASAIVDVDLVASPTPDKLKLVLDVSGTIAGMVVDSSNDPVAEAQVTATMDLWGGDADDRALGGFASATTDGGGGFVIHGLADGEYQLAAHRGGTGTMGAAWGTGAKPSMAKTGDSKVRLVLPTPGRIKGKLVLASGDPPKLATVSVGWQKSTPAIGGSFTLTDVAPGSYDLTIRGPEFAEASKQDIEVATGKTVDVGTIKLERGRRLVGTVVDGNGQPVAGAQVRVGKMIFTEGGKAGADDPNIDQLIGHRVAFTGNDGAFALVGIPKDGGSIVAEHTDLGRSDALLLPAGDDDPPAMKLVLHGFGSIAGKVTSKGQPLAAMVMATPKTGGTQFVSVQSGPDGAFVIDKVAEGPQRLTAMKLGMMSMSSSDSVEVQVKAGQRITANIDLKAGDLTVEIAIKAKAGQSVNAAQVFLFRGTVAARTGKDLRDAFTAGGAQAGGMQFWIGLAPVKFEEILPGKVSICSIPITGDLQDPKFQQRLQKLGDRLSVYCMGLELPATPKAQSYPQELPTMTMAPGP